MVHSGITGNLEQGTIDVVPLSVQTLGHAALSRYGIIYTCPITQKGYIFWWSSRREYHRSVQIAAQETRLGNPKTVLELSRDHKEYPNGDAAIRALLGHEDHET